MLGHAGAKEPDGSFDLVRLFGPSGSAPVGDWRADIRGHIASTSGSSTEALVSIVQQYVGDRFMYPWVLVQCAPHEVASSVKDLCSRLDACVVDQVECEELAGVVVVEIDSLGEGNGEDCQRHLSSRCHLTAIECHGEDESDDDGQLGRA